MLKFSRSVAKALSSNLPIVALESTIITHGMPFPQNLSTAKQVEDAIRREGSVPATIAILNGKISIGLEEEELEVLARVGRNAVKTSRRDLPRIISNPELYGSTTVAATMIAAKMAGIKVFVTGGIGGVHRESDWDVSADLEELGKTNVAVVCAGAKSILDIEATLEFLETKGVPVVSFGESDEFPAFYTRKSGFKSMAAVESPKECANMIDTSHKLGLNTGMVIACPIPEDDVVKNGEALEKVIKNAVREAKDTGVRGKDITPFLLAKVSEVTKGDSLRANIALILNNAKIGSRIAVELSKLEKRAISDEGISLIENNNEGSASVKGERKPRIAVFGGAVVDINSNITSPTLYTSNPGKIKVTTGGVGRNIAQVCHQKGSETILVANVSDDVHGNVIKSDLKNRGMGVDGLSLIKGKNTPVYNATFGNGELIVATADMELAEEEITRVEEFLEKSSFVVVDGNVGVETLKRICKSPCTKPILFEPTSVVKSVKVFQIGEDMKNVKFITPDRYEAKAMAEMINGKIDIELQDNNVMKEETAAMSKLLSQFPNVIIKSGEKGCLVGTSRPTSRNCNTGKKSVPETKITHIQPTRKINIVNVSGAGDSLVGVVASLLSAEEYPQLISHKRLVEIVREGVRAAEMTCEVDGISSDIK